MAMTQSFSSSLSRRPPLSSTFSSPGTRAPPPLTPSWSPPRHRARRRALTAASSIHLGPEQIAELVRNKVLIAATVASAIGQLSKPFTSIKNGGGVDIRAVVRSGGMPSTHSAAAAALCYGMFTNTTMSFSSMVGPAEKVEFYGHPIVYIAPGVYGHPHALTVHYQSYMNTIKLVLTVDDAQFPDSHQLLDDFAETLRHIRQAASTKP